MKKIALALSIAACVLNFSCTQQPKASCCAETGGTELAAVENPQATTAYGIVEGVNESGVAAFKGIPYAAPPVGDLRWRAPQPVEKWTGVKEAKQYGPNPMQKPVWGDMGFQTDAMEEDCLYLNIWTPAKRTDAKLPVFIYINGGGLYAGAGSEPRYGGAGMARKGIVMITFNYREDIFGFFAHPELTAESDYRGSGNYGFLDQVAMLQWVKDNIAAFGGDPDNITIMGESAGSYSVSVLMASPLSKGNIAKAMGSSGSLMAETWRTQEEADALGMEMQAKIGVASLAELRAMPADELMAKANITDVPVYNIDNYLMPEQPADIYREGRQAQVPCLIGNNSGEMVPMMVCGGNISLEGMRAGIKAWTGADDADVEKLMQYYRLEEDADVMQLPGYACAGDKFIVYSTWKWTDVQQATSTQPVYRYRFGKIHPGLYDPNRESGLAGGTKEKSSSAPAPLKPGAFHAEDIEYSMGTIPTMPAYAWTAEDFAVSQVFNTYIVNFIKTGNPNGLGVPRWDPVNGEDVPPVMCINVKTAQERDASMQARYRLLDKYLAK